jgi:hypothetical protein
MIPTAVRQRVAEPPVKSKPTTCASVQRVDKVATLSEKCKIAFLGIQDFLCRFATRPEILQGSGDKLRSSAAYMPPPVD